MNKIGKFLTMTLLLSTVLYTSCASVPYNTSKPEMSVPEDSPYKTPPRTFNQFHNEWDY